jgi:hypothetical protein
MSQKKIRLYNLKGRWQAMGEELGRAVADDIATFNNRYFSDAFNMMRFGSMENVLRYAHRVGASLKDYSQNAWEFLTGMAAGAKLPIDEILMQSILPELTHVNSRDDWPTPSGGCTACCVKESFTAEQAAIIGQCWDFNIELPDWYAARLSPPLGQPEMLIMGMGAFFCSCGLNSFGLGMTFTASGHLPNVKPLVGVPLVGAFIEALGCEDYYHAMDLLVAPRRAGAMNMLLSDGYADSSLIEVADTQVELTEEEPILVCGNHFQHPKIVERTKQNLTPRDRAPSEFARSTVHRTNRLRTLLSDIPKGTITVKAVKECLADHENQPLSICAHEEETILHFRTQGAMILTPALRTIEFCPGQPCKTEYEPFSL